MNTETTISASRRSRSWSRFCKAGSADIKPGSPWQNARVERVGSRIHDELLAVEQFSRRAEAQATVADWR